MDFLSHTKNINEVYNMYVSISYGHEIEDKDLINKIKCSAGYLLDNKMTVKQTLTYLINNNADINDDLWEGKLTKPNTYYFHNQLRITNDVPIWTPVTEEKTTKFYVEMKFNYTMKDLLDYYYNQLLIPLELRDEKRDSGALTHLINKFHFKSWDSLDFILCLIDIARENETTINNVFDLEKNTTESYDMMEYYNNHTRNKSIIWRDYHGV